MGFTLHILHILQNSEESGILWGTPSYSVVPSGALGHSALKGLLRGFFICKDNLQAKMGFMHFRYFKSQYYSFVF